MKIKRELKSRVERYISAYPSWVECGGYLLRNRRQVVAEFVPIPNDSADPINKFQSPKRSKEVADKVASSRRMYVEAFWHSHPTPCIMSAADTCYAQSTDLIFITISRLKEWGEEYIWYACQGIKPIPIDWV